MVRARSVRKAGRRLPRRHAGAGGVGVGEDRVGGGAVVGARSWEKKGSVSSCTRAKRAARVAARVAASVPQKAARRARPASVSGRRWVWASSSICRRCSISRWAT